MLLPPDLKDWLPEDHLVHFVLDVVETMDMGEFKVNHRGTGNRQYPPSMMLSLLAYCYATGRFSSRMIERASWEDVAVRYLCAGEHPDHETICKFRRENLKAFEKFFVHILEVASRSQALKKVGTVSVDGTKLKANASKHSAMSHGHAVKVQEQLENEVQELTARAEEADRQEQSQCETKLPEEIARRKQRMARIREAVDVIEEREKAKVEQERKRREAKAEARKQRRERGEKVGGPEPKEVEDKVDPKAQYNFTDPESRIMKTKLCTEQGRQRYALRKQTVEPVFPDSLCSFPFGGIFDGKEVMRFRQFLMRGMEKTAGEWNLVCCSYNLKRLFSLMGSRSVSFSAPGGQKTA